MMITSNAGTWLRIPVSCLMVPLALAIGSISSAHGQERMYTVRNPGVWTHDPQTGAPLGWNWSGPISGGGGRNLASHNGRLIGIGAFGGFGCFLHQQVISINPADAFPTGSPCVLGNFVHQIEGDPVSGVLYCNLSQQLYTLDPATGQMNYIANVTGAPAGVTCFAIRHDGVAFAINPGRSLWTLDLNTGILNQVGTIQIAIPQGLQFGLFEDAAFDRFGQLWATWWVGSTGSNGVLYNGLYKIDMTTLTAVRMQAFNEPFGVAFLPDCDCTTYCTGKTNGAGCVPSIGRNGLPSPTAQSGFEITASDVVNETVGLLAWTLNGRIANPFQGGTWCLRSPLRRTPLRSSGGSARPVIDCSGKWALDFNTYMQQIIPPSVGTTISCQWYGRDPVLAAPQNVQLSNALEFVLLP